MQNLKTIFSELVQKYSDDNSLNQELWNEIVENYSGKKRHYHNLSHLENLIKQLLGFKEIISDWDVVLFSVFYHDIVYNTLKQDNEEQSALLAETKLKALKLSNEQIEKCKAAILATKSHELSKDKDINLFTDADLSILGAGWDEYSAYAKQIRKEYSIYPDLIYNPGRKKVLHHFLHMQNIFKTPEFFDTFEKQARQNLKRELREL
jgi:predicted metal-dependent HD superfamily phosphohydrolase